MNSEDLLLDDEIVEKLCIVSCKKDKVDEIFEIKAEALKKSIGKGNPVDDLKSASGFFFVAAKKALGLTKCGNDTVSFLRDTMAPLVTQETEVNIKERTSHNTHPLFTF
jgi:hypothetical protein